MYRRPPRVRTTSPPWIPTLITPRLTNTAEGGSDETTVTPGNSGGASGDAFDNVVISVGTLVFDDARTMHGGFAYRSSTVGTSGSNYLEWAKVPTLGAKDEQYFRGYFQFDALPDVHSTVIAIVSQGGEWTLRLRIKSDGTLDMQDENDTIITGSTTSTALSADTWYRIECYTAFGDANTGICELRLYAGDSTIPLETKGPLTGQDLGESRGYRVFTGAAAATSVTNTLVLWIDDIALDAYDWIGPSATPSSLVYPPMASSLRYLVRT